MRPVLLNEYGIVLLAAGSSSRLGSPKQLLYFQGSPLIKRAASLALEISNKVVVVTGSEAHKIKTSINDLPLHIVYNPLFEEGIASSIRIGVAQLEKSFEQIAGAIFIVCDQPYLQPAIIRNLVDVSRQTNKGIIASAYASTLGVPVLFGQKYFYKLLQLKGDTGAKKLISEHPDDVASVVFPLGIIDIDTIEEYKALVEKE